MGDAKEGRFEIKHSDEAVRGALVTQGGQVLFPPPPPKPKPVKEKSPGEGALTPPPPVVEDDVKVGQCRLTISNPVLKAPTVSALETGIS